MRLGNTSFPETVVTPGGLVAAESDTGNVGAVVDRSVLGKGTPATAQVENRVTRLEIDLLADHSHLVIAEFLEGFFPVDIADDARGIKHARTQEPSIEIITSVVVVTDLLLI